VDDFQKGVRRGGRPFSFTSMNALFYFSLLAAAVTQMAGPTAAAQAPATEQEGKAYVYKRAGDRELKIYVFEPAGHDGGDDRPAILVLHGGGWTEGSAEWAFGQAQYFATRGIVGISVDYRLADGKETTPFDAAEDARAAIRWVRTHAKELRIDREQVIAYGESAGGRLAAATAITGENPTKEELNTVPNALVLFSPVIEIERSENFRTLSAGKKLSSLSLEEHVRKGMPPTLVIAGEMDKTIPLEGLKEFCARMKRAHNQCEVQVFKGVGHELWDVDVSVKSRKMAAKVKYDAFLRVDEFLASLGYIKRSRKH
jgi:acetyl esterase